VFLIRIHITELRWCKDPVVGLKRGCDAWYLPEMVLDAALSEVLFCKISRNRYTLID